MSTRLVFKLKNKVLQPHIFQNIFNVDILRKGYFIKLFTNNRKQKSFQYVYCIPQYINRFSLQLDHTFFVYDTNDAWTRGQNDYMKLQNDWDGSTGWQTVKDSVLYRNEVGREAAELSDWAVREGETLPHEEAMPWDWVGEREWMRKLWWWAHGCGWLAAFQKWQTAESTADESVAPHRMNTKVSIRARMGD